MGLRCLLGLSFICSLFVRVAYSSSLRDIRKAFSDTNVRTFCSGSPEAATLISPDLQLTSVLGIYFSPSVLLEVTFPQNNGDEVHATIEKQLPISGHFLCACVCPCMLIFRGIL